MATALITHADGLTHVTPAGHPERVARLEHVLHALQGMDLLRVTAPEAEDEDLRLCHPQSYIDRIAAALPRTGTRQLDADTFLSAGSMRAARRAVGGAMRGVDMVLGGEANSAFCAMRPPGHHAERETPMGFCLFGTVAIAAKHALDRHGLSRVVVVDFDVHHGNGTQDLLWDEKRTLFVSSQQMPLWPGTGSPDETGAHDNVLNVALVPDSGGNTMRSAYETRVFPRLREFAPELLLISAGFDAHADDPLAQLNWETVDFAWLTAELCAIAKASGAPVVSVLEGGYDLAALAESAAAHVITLTEKT
ncbi:histone deacetylase family protein [Citreimonas salinaria]|uniref:Acetoin utilization deacetylase AcuC n=1 Tax=Citreimonas salinaria TaxID=321339 RepID=A0A1H3JII4_9RHOB|nr:histone deacetylase family protein [Citreimonas salinaria]SDY39228.1 Acetoin utilization deacetylase AcuC [Citreimonas salinaria]